MRGVRTRVRRSFISISWLLFGKFSVGTRPVTRIFLFGSKDRYKYSHKRHINIRIKSSLFYDVMWSLCHVVFEYQAQISTQTHLLKCNLAWNGARKHRDCSPRYVSLTPPSFPLFAILVEAILLLLLSSMQQYVRYHHREEPVFWTKKARVFGLLDSQKGAITPRHVFKT